MRTIIPKSLSGHICVNKLLADDKTLSEYNGFVNGNDKTIQSFISTASIALSPIGINDNLEKITYTHSIDFKKLRSEKSVVFIKIEQQYQEQYSFLLNLFYSQLFNSMMDRQTTNKDLHLYCLLDEFGNMNIGNLIFSVGYNKLYL